MSSPSSSAYSASGKIIFLHFQCHLQSRPFTFLGVIIRNHHLLNAVFVLGKKRQGLHASLQGAPTRPNFLETRKPRLQEADFLSTVSMGPGEEGR